MFHERHGVADQDVWDAKLTVLMVSLSWSLKCLQFTNIKTMPQTTGTTDSAVGRYAVFLPYLGWFHHVPEFLSSIHRYLSPTT